MDEDRTVAGAGAEAWASIVEALRGTVTRQQFETWFRRAAGDLLTALPEGSGRLVIDLSSTRHVDSAGLGALMLVQRKAAERRVPVSLRGASEELRFLLVLTKLDDLFEIEGGAA